MNDLVSQPPPNRQGATLGFRMFLAFSFVMLVSAVGIALVMDRVIREITLSERGAQLTRNAEMLSRVMEADLRHQLANIAARANSLSQAGLLAEPSALRRSLDGLQRSMPEYAWLGFASVDGTVRVATGGHMVGESVSIRPWFLSGLRGRRFDLILMDIEMPDMSGLDVCRHIRSGNGPNRASRVVALTGYAFDADIEKAVAAGMNAHMAKPVMLPALRAQIAKGRAAAGE